MPFYFTSETILKELFTLLDQLDDVYTRINRVADNAARTIGKTQSLSSKQNKKRTEKGKGKDALDSCHTRKHRKGRHRMINKKVEVFFLNLRPAVYLSRLYG